MPTAGSYYLDHWLLMTTNKNRLAKDGSNLYCAMSEGEQFNWPQILRASKKFTRITLIINSKAIRTGVTACLAE